MPLDVSLVRQQFPSLNRPAIFLDNPAGTQISKQSLDRINRYLLECNANHEGQFETSRKSDEILHEAHAAMADFLNASQPEEIIFGNNMTTLTLHISRSLARLLKPGDNILVTRLDHDANISPWMLIAEDRGCNLLWVDIDVEQGTLDLDDFARALEKKPKIAAFGYASNLLGTVNPVRKLTQMAKDAGALVYIDAVQYAPHGAIDVQDIGCDFLVCSSYKYCRTKTTRHLQFHGSPGHRKAKRMTFLNQIPKWVPGITNAWHPFLFMHLLIFILDIAEHIRILADVGYQGLAELHENCQTPFKKSKYHPLIKKEKQKNQSLAPKRIVIEHFFAAIVRLISLHLPFPGI